jgi:RND superfamily putative drug exporter
VLVGFAALLFTPMVETRSLGIGGMVVVGVSVLLSVTLLPAVLTVAGGQIDWPLWLARRLTPVHARRFWRRWADAVNRRPGLALVSGGMAMAVLTAPVFSLRIGLPARHWWPSHTDSADGTEVLQRLGAGATSQPIRLLVEFPAGTSAVSAGALRGLQRLSDSIRADPRIRLVRSVANPGPVRSILALSILYSNLDDARAAFPEFVDSYLSRDGRMALLEVVLADSTSLTSAMEVTRGVRRLSQHPFRGLQGTVALVGGFFAETIDLQDALLARFPLVVTLVLGVTGLMLAVAFRSLLVPLKAILMNSLSVAASFGLLVLVFQEGVGGRLLGLDGPGEAIFAVVPVLVFAIVFGLSMDYEVFLLSRVKEAFDRCGKNDQAVAEGLAASAGTITSAALVMILVFGAFAFARVFVVQALGFGLAAAVLLDATIIRMVLVPSLMRLAGRWNWWPGVR